MLIRCSALRLAMTEARAKNAGLSETAKKVVEDEIRTLYFGVREKISSKAMQKGIDCEQQSIDLLNNVEFRLSKPYVKNSERKSNQWITGECDIYDAESRTIRDIKTSWSIATYPLFADNANDYEWQMRGYMMLWDCDTAIVDYCLVDTPEHLIGYEQRELHIVSHIDPEKRVKSFVFERDEQKEQRIKERCEQLQEYFLLLKQRFKV
ncbi:MAG TPA: hypothetical protein PKL69_03135 [Agitococcus sp.]|nr:hypothetical protein [Agitococcus sp.]HNL79329.1 hypothetical protein [Agitococcus sp.]